MQRVTLKHQHRKPIQHDIVLFHDRCPFSSAIGRLLSHDCAINSTHTAHHYYERLGSECDAYSEQAIIKEDTKI